MLETKFFQKGYLWGVTNYKQKISLSVIVITNKILIEVGKKMFINLNYCPRIN